MPEMRTIGDEAEVEKATPPDRRCRLRALGYNLPDVFAAAWSGGGPATNTGHRRVVRTVDSAARDVGAAQPLPVIGFADGVQTQFLLRHVEHRPISLAWVAAGAVDNGATLLEFRRQRLELVASAADGEFVQGLREVAGGMPCHLVEDLTPWGVAIATQRLVDEWRRELEQDVVGNVPIPAGGFLMVDGSIRRHARDCLVGVIRSVEETQYLADESAVPDRAGWRSAVFSLPATTTEETDVVSCYLRLHDAPARRVGRTA